MKGASLNRDLYKSWQISTIQNSVTCAQISCQEDQDLLSVDPRRGNACELGIAMLNDPVEIFVFWLVYLSELNFL